MKAGTLTFNFGTVNGAGLTADSSLSSKTITIADGATLARWQPPSTAPRWA
jgi:hypothetical protein